MGASTLERDVRLDALRGLALVSMMCNHLPGKYVSFIGDPLGFSSFAEVFILLSGIVAGYVYGHVLIKQGQPALSQKARKRALTIYVYQIALFIILFTICQCVEQVKFYWYRAMPLFFDEPWQALFSGIFLLYGPVAANLLPMYFLYILLVPLVLIAFQKNRAIHVFIISIILWMLAQFHLLYHFQVFLNQYFPVRLVIFDLMAWQLLFIIGLYLGFRKGTGQHLQPSVMKKSLYIAIPCFVVFFALRHHLLANPLPASLFHHLTGLKNLGPVRLLNFAVIGLIVVNVSKWLMCLPFAASLSFLGQHSLQVYCFHVLVVYVLYLMPEFWNSPHTGPQALAIALVVALLWLPAWLHAHFRRKILAASGS